MSRRLPRSVVLEARDRVVFEEELGEERDGDVDLTSPGGPDEALLEEAVAMRSGSALVFGPHARATSAVD